MSATLIVELLIAVVPLALLAGWLFGRWWAERCRGNAYSSILGAFGWHCFEVHTATGVIADINDQIILTCCERPFTDFDGFIAQLEEESAILLREKVRSVSGRQKKAEMVTLKTKTQQVVECLVTASPSRASHAALLLQDITLRYRHQSMLQGESETTKEEARRYAAILNTSSMPIWMRDKDLNIVYCNLAYSRIVEDVHTTEEENKGFPELSRQARRLAEAARREKTEKVERAHIIVGGHRKPYFLQESYIADFDITVGFAQDLSELEAAEEEIKSHLTAQKGLLESSSSAIAIYGSDARLKYYNQAYVRLWGYDEAWLDAQPKFGEVLEKLREMRKLPEQANFQEYKRQRLRLFTDMLEPKEELHFLPDGRTVRSVAIPYRGGGVMLSYEDVTDRLALERSYNTLIAVQRETLDNLHEAVVVFGEDGRIRLKNPAFLKMWKLRESDAATGVHVTEVIDKVWNLLPQKNPGQLREHFLARMQSRMFDANTVERTDGSVLHRFMVPLPDGGTLVTYTDVTDSTLVERSLRDKNEALQAADRLKSEFLANISYELRSPLTSIAGFSEMLRENYFGDLNERQREYINDIYASSQHLIHLVSDILDLAGIEAGYLALEISEFDIRRALESVLSLQEARLRDAGLVGKLDCPEDIGSIQGDETRVRQVLFHLLSNAIKYSPRERAVSLGASRGRDGVTFWVRDEGVGINPDEQGQIFDKFFRGSAGSNKSGTGLGLSLVKNFIELHGGSVILESEPEKGTMVRCFVPDPTQEK